MEEVKVPCSPVNNIEQVFDDPHVKHREMKIEMDHELSGSGKVPLIGNPLKRRRRPQYRRPPPTLGQHTEEVLSEILELNSQEIKELRDKRAI